MERLPDHSPTVTVADLTAFRAALIADLTAAVEKQKCAPIPFARFRVDFLALYRPPMRSPGTFGKVRQVLAIVAELVGPAGTTADLTADLVVRFITGRPAGESPNTTRGLLQVLRTICNHCAAQGSLLVSPFALRKRWIRAGQRQAETVRHHSIEDIGRVLALAAHDIETKVPGSWAQWRARRLHALAATVAYTGMRRTEILRLRVEDIVFGDRMILVTPRAGNRLKTEASAQPVPMTEALAGILAAWLPFLALPPETGALAGKRDPGWVFPNGYRTGPWIGGKEGDRPIDRIKRLGYRCGVEGFTFLSLRHSWATHAESRWGLPEAFVQRVLRHTTKLTQKHYRHADAANLREGMKCVTFGVEAHPPAELPEARLSPIVYPTPATGPVWRDPKNPSKPGVWHCPKLTPEDVREARELRSRGWTYAKLRARYGVSRSTLSALFNGLTHRGI